MFRFTTLTIFALAATFVAAQDTSTTSPATPDASGTPSTCIVDCSTTAATAAGCTSYTDFACVCTSAAFQTAAGMCITATCPDQLAAATALQQQACAGVSSGAASGTPSDSVSGSISAPSTTATGTTATGTTAPTTSRPSTTSKPSGTGTPTSSTASSSRSGAAFKNAPVAGAMGALAALVGAAIL